jgi:hypothetical protein
MRISILKCEHKYSEYTTDLLHNLKQLDNLATIIGHIIIWSEQRGWCITNIRKGDIDALISCGYSENKSEITFYIER